MLRLDLMAQLAAFGLQQRDLFGDGDGLRSGPYLQTDIQAHDLRDLHDDVLPDVRLKARRRYGHLVRPWWHLRDRVIARRRSGGLV